MINEIDKQLMLKFLERNYPVSRIKFNGRFKRGIFVENGAYLLSEPHQFNELQFKLFEIIIKVFSCEEDISKAVLSNFLKLT